MKIKKGTQAKDEDVRNRWRGKRKKKQNTKRWRKEKRKKQKQIGNKKGKGKKIEKMKIDCISIQF